MKTGTSKTIKRAMIANIILVILFVIFSTLGTFELPGITGLLLIFGLALFLSFRAPRLAFLLLAGMIALETVNLAPAGFPVMLRPYQLLTFALLLALGMRWLFLKRKPRLAQCTIVDWAVLALVAFSLISALFSTARGESVKQALVLFSMALIYWLARTFVGNVTDIKKALQFFLGSSVVVMGYAIWQNVRFAHGLESFEVMPGRPNATFAEAEWLGLYVLLLLSAAYSIFYYLLRKYGGKIKNKKPARLAGGSKIINLFLYLAVVYIILVITVSRSAWLGGLAMTMLFLAIVLTNLKLSGWQWRRFLADAISMSAIFLVSISVVKILNLTTFELFQRAQSTGGSQEITISCENKEGAKKVPHKIKDIAELNAYNCRHINLEEIDSESEKGNIVLKINRPDPNVNVRAQIYQKSWEQIKAHPLLGIGWGSIGPALGTDELGHSFNASNIFLEVWLGAGIGGLLALVAILVYIGYLSVRTWKNSQEPQQRTVALSVMLFGAGFLAFNLFNSGLLLGFFWLWLGGAISALSSFAEGEKPMRQPLGALDGNKPDASGVKVEDLMK